MTAGQTFMIRYAYLTAPSAALFSCAIRLTVAPSFKSELSIATSGSPKILELAGPLFAGNRDGRCGDTALYF